MTIETTAQDVADMHAFVERVCNQVGPRAPCSPSEARAADIIKTEMEKTCDDVVVEPFTCAPGGLLGWIRADIVLVGISFAIYFSAPFVMPGNTGWWLHAACLAIVLLAWVIAWKQFFCYEEFIDRFLKKGNSQNVIGRILPDCEVKRVIAFSGHHDSAPRYNLLEYLRGAGYAGSIVWGFGTLGLWTVSMAIATVSSIAGLGQGGIYHFSAWLAAIGFPALVLLWFFKSSGDRGNVVPGAVDNISAVAVVLQIGKYIKAHPGAVPAGTEVRLISFGCEEAGLRGAYRYVAAHRTELERKNFQLVNMDGLQSPKTFMAFAFEPTTRTPHDPRVTGWLVEAAGLAGVQLRTFGNRPLDRVAGFFSGGTDAAAFSKAGIPACSFGALDVLAFVDNYHTSRDVPSCIEPGTLDGALKICIAYLAHTAAAGRDGGGLI